MVMRQLNATEEERRTLIEGSVEKAKEAVQFDIKDGTSWCMLIYQPEFMFTFAKFFKSIPLMPLFFQWKFKKKFSLLLSVEN